ncbi:hypothetical protein [Bradyrhizobium sp. WD16]|uniref:hypothetical protein n=1 Tax=Bradyrhizobium sp. WD16 TaxID=1521768 RepID=UPI0020A3AA4F|nr:hypothetical protein [Bradyrhizobium sp. WD16]UTD26716.1 hypothetical protein DB459_07035 [Bradyrhizobium sp. WD16]
MRRQIAGMAGAVCLAAMIGLAGAGEAEAADGYAMSGSQRIFCGRGLSAGKLQTSTCRSYTYIFDTTTTEYYRCAASVTVTKDNKDLMRVESEGGCQKKPRLFTGDSSYAFDVAETEGPNTTAFFGPGGYVIWASDTKKLAAKVCFTINVGGKEGEVSRCIDMKFE